MKDAHRRQNDPMSYSATHSAKHYNASPAISEQPNRQSHIRVDDNGGDRSTIINDRIEQHLQDINKKYFSGTARSAFLHSSANKGEPAHYNNSSMDPRNETSRFVDEP